MTLNSEIEIPSKNVELGVNFFKFFTLLAKEPAPLVEKGMIILLDNWCCDKKEAIGWGKFPSHIG